MDFQNGIVLASKSLLVKNRWFQIPSLLISDSQDGHWMIMTSSYDMSLWNSCLPSSKRLQKTTVRITIFFMGKSTISMASPSPPAGMPWLQRCRAWEQDNPLFRDWGSRSSHQKKHGDDWGMVYYWFYLIRSTRRRPDLSRSIWINTEKARFGSMWQNEPMDLGYMLLKNDGGKPSR